jgi:hypothetical protein
LKVTVDNKTAVVRMPTDAEWTAYLKAQQIVVRKLGGGRYADPETVDVSDKALALFNEIAGDGQEFDKDQAEEALQKLADTRIDEVEKIGEDIHMCVVMAGRVESRIVCRCPLAGERKAYRKARMTSTPEATLNRIRVHPEAAIALYDKICPTPLTVPAKIAVVSRVLEFLELGDNEVDPT